MFQIRDWRNLKGRHKDVSEGSDKDYEITIYNKGGSKMNGKHLVLTLLIGISLICSPLSINELSDDSDPSNDIAWEEAKPLKMENSLRENSDPSKDISTETEPMKIENPIREDSIKPKDKTIEEGELTFIENSFREDTNAGFVITTEETKPMIIEDPLEVDSYTSEDISIAKASSMNIEYQIGTVMIGPPDEEFWSDWASNGDLANATYPGLSAPGIFQMRVIAPGYHVEYQIGFNDQWSIWASDGDVAAVKYSGIPCPGFIQMRMITQGYQVEYQIKFNQHWSLWTANGAVATLNYSGFICPGELCMRAVLNPLEDCPNNTPSAEPSPAPNNLLSSSSTVEYQIGYITAFGTEYWSSWASDGDEANVTYNTWTVPGTYAMKVRAPGYHIEYQIGYITAFGTEYWSPWTSDGNEAGATYNVFTISGTFAMKIKAPGYHVEYQIGYWGDWSPWTSDGLEANITFNTFSGSFPLSMRAIMIVPPEVTIDIDPNSLNLKSKGKWITCYITLNSPYDVNDIDISKVMLEDTIPAEWGDIQGETLMVKFDRSDVENMLSPGTYNLKVTGELTDGTGFEGYSDEISVIDPP